MKKLLKKFTLLLLGILSTFSMMLFVGCSEPEVMPSVSFGFKTIDGAANYNESIDAFEIGKDFYTCIEIKLTTDKKKPIDLQVVVTIPKTNEVVVDQTGGKKADFVGWDNSLNATVLVFSMKGSKGIGTEKVMFKGIPVDEGSAQMSVDVYYDDGVAVDSGYFRTIFFKYEINN